MSDGATHFKASVAASCVVAPVAFVFLQNDVAIAVTIGSVVGWFVTPDVRDIQRKTFPSFKLSTIPLVGGVVELLFLIFWFPLALALPHRSKLSHFPFLGTFVAFTYGVIYGLIIVTVIQGLSIWSSDILATYVALLTSQLGVAFYFGWCVPDILHWIMDRGWRRPGRRRRRFFSRFSRR